MSDTTQVILTEQQVWAFVLQVSSETIHEMARRVDGDESTSWWQSFWDSLVADVAGSAMHDYMQEEQTIDSMLKAATTISGYAIAEMARLIWRDHGLKDVADSAFSNWLYDHRVELGVDSERTYECASDLSEAWLAAHYPDGVTT